MRHHNLQVTGSVVVNGLGLATTADLNTYTASADAKISTLQSFTASVGTTNTFTASASSRLNSIETITASNVARIGSLETISASNIARISSLEITSTSNVARLTSLEIRTGSLATTGSNTFIGTQTITGSLFISADLIVQGSSSLQNITASAVSIGTNIVNLNTANPAIRYAGLVIGDSGSIGSSGSFFYDSVQDEMIFVHRGANTTVTSSVVLMGPQTFDNIGTELYPTSNRIQKGTGNEHLVDSCIFDNGTTICVNGNLIGSGNACITSVCSPAFVGGTISGTTGNFNGRIVLNGTSYDTTTSAEVQLNNTTTTTGRNMVLNSLNLGGFQIADKTAGGATRLTIDSTGITTFNCQICTPSLVACVSSAAAITIDGYSKLSFADRGIEYGSINASRYNFGGETTMMTFQSGRCFLFLNGTNCLMFIGSNGNVGIGTTSPTFALDVASTSADNLRLNRIGVGGTGSASSMSFQVTQTNSQSATLASISAEFISNWGGDLRFYTKPANGTPNDSVTERMRITSGGSAIFQSSLGICNGGAINMTIPNGNNGGSIRMSCCTGANQGDMYLTGGSGTGLLIAGAGHVGIGTLNMSSEGNLFLGAKGTIEGGQLVLQKGTSCSCATHLDNYQDSFRILVGTDTGSTGVHFQLDHKTRCATFYGGIRQTAANGALVNQKISGIKAAAGSGTAVTIAYVGHTHTITVRAYARLNDANAALITQDFSTAYGSSAAGASTVAGFNQVSSISLAYNNSGYVIQVTPIYSTGTPDIYFTIEGISHDTMYVT